MNLCTVAAVRCSDPALAGWLTSGDPTEDVAVTPNGNILHIALITPQGARPWRIIAAPKEEELGG